MSSELQARVAELTADRNDTQVRLATSEDECDGLRERVKELELETHTKAELVERASEIMTRMGADSSHLKTRVTEVEAHSRFLSNHDGDWEGMALQWKAELDAKTAQVDALKRDLQMLGEGCHVRKVHIEWPALEPRIRKARSLDKAAETASGKARRE